VNARGLLCALPLGLYIHKPERIATAAGFAFRCTDCGATSTTEAELLHLNGYVNPSRWLHERDNAA
jgi:hypothetical protein